MLEALARAARCFEVVRDFARAAEIRFDRLGFLQRTAAAGSAEEAAAAGELGIDYFRLRDFLPARGMFEHQRKLAAPDSAEALAATARLGDVALAAGDMKAALEERARLVAGCARRFGRNHGEFGRALLLLGETQLAAENLASAEESFRDAGEILKTVQPTDPLVSRIAADRAVIALRQGREVDARLGTREALSGTTESDDAMAEVLARLGDAWAARGDVRTAEGPLAAALDLLIRGAGALDETALTLMERVGRMRLQNGSPGAATLFERALAGTEALYGRESAEVAELLGWVALAQGAAGADESALANAIRRVALLERNAPGDAAILAEARWMRAWLSWRVTGAEPAWAELVDGVTRRWSWLALGRGVVGW